MLEVWRVWAVCRGAGNILQRRQSNTSMKELRTDRSRPRHLRTRAGIYTQAQAKSGNSLVELWPPVGGPTRHVMLGCRWSLPADWDVIEGCRAVLEES